MRTRAGVAALMMLFGLGPVLGALAARAPGQRFVTVDGGSDATPATLREGPSSGFPALGAVAAGTRLEELGCAELEDETWCRVRLDDPSGAAPRGWLPASRLAEGAARGESGAANPAPVRLRYDASGTVPCSAPHDHMDADCTFRRVRDGRGATFLLANPARDAKAPLRVLRVEHGRFSTRDGTLIWVTRRDDELIVAVDGDEYYQFDPRLVPGPGLRDGDAARRRAPGASTAARRAGKD